MRDFVVALGLMAAIEGLLYAASPPLMKRTLKQVLGFSDNTLRIGGLAAMLVGVLVVWIARH